MQLMVQKWLRMDHTAGAGNWTTVITERSIWTHFDALKTKLYVANDFLWLFDTSFPQKRKKSCFWILKKSEKYVFSNTGVNFVNVALSLSSYDTLDTWWGSGHMTRWNNNNNNNNRISIAVVCQMTSSSQDYSRRGKCRPLFELWIRRIKHYFSGGDVNIKDIFLTSKTAFIRVSLNGYAPDHHYACSMRIRGRLRVNG